MRYDRVYERLATRAVDQTSIDLDTLVGQLTDAGLGADEIETRLLDDLETSGPVFGKFFRSLGAAAESATSTAFRQGQRVGSALEYDMDLVSILKRNDLDLIDDGDPEALAAVEASVRVMSEIWICTLKKTCDRCLPLHGKVLTSQEWDARGLIPDIMHEGWDSDCLCLRMPEEEALDEHGGRDDLKAPLVRLPQRSETGLKLSRRTARSVAQNDIDRAMAAVDKARDSLEGRRTLRLLGQVSKDDE